MFYLDPWSTIIHHTATSNRYLLFVDKRFSKDIYWVSWSAWMRKQFRQFWWDVIIRPYPSFNAIDMVIAWKSNFTVVMWI